LLAWNSVVRRQDNEHMQEVLIKIGNQSSQKENQQRQPSEFIAELP
jgi:hypothetical protein